MSKFLESDAAGRTDGHTEYDNAKSK